MLLTVEPEKMRLIIKNDYLLPVSLGDQIKQDTGQHEVKCSILKNS